MKSCVNVTKALDWVIGAMVDGAGLDCWFHCSEVACKRCYKWRQPNPVLLLIVLTLQWLSWQISLQTIFVLVCKWQGSLLSKGITIPRFTWSESGSGITQRLKIRLWFRIHGRNHNTSTAERKREKAGGGRSNKCGRYKTVKRPSLWIARSSSILRSERQSHHLLWWRRPAIGTEMEREIERESQFRYTRNRI